MHLDHAHSFGGPHTPADSTSHIHEHPHGHSHNDGSPRDGDGCIPPRGHTPMEELLALMQYTVSHNAAHARELADLAVQLERAGNHRAYEQVMAAVSDFEKGNLQLRSVLAQLKD